MNAIKIITVWLLLPVTIQAQQPDSTITRVYKNQLGFGLGYQSRQLIDEQKSALVYQSKEYQAKIFFNKERKQSLFLTSLDFSLGSFYAKHQTGRHLYSVDYDIDGSVTIDSVPVTSGILAGKFKITYLRSISNKSLAWKAGGTIQDQLIYPENYIGLLNSLSLNATVYVSKKIQENHTVSAKLEVPVAAVNTRLPWHNTATDPVESEMSTFFKKGSRFVTLDKFQSLQLNLNYSFRVSSRWNIGGDYELTWIRVPYYQPMKSFVNRISVFTSYNF